MTDEKPTTIYPGSSAEDGRIMRPWVARNRDPILEVLRPHLSSGMRVLEIASGSGEHGAHMMSNISGLIWQPSDLSEEARTSIAAWAKYSGDENFLPPVVLDASSNTWPLGDTRFDGMLCINMIHIAPIEAARGVICGGDRHLKQGGFLYFYGPFTRGGAHTAPSNEAFDQSLKSRDPSWGIRDVDEIDALAGEAGFELKSITEMPANNLSLIFRR